MSDLVQLVNLLAQTVGGDIKTNKAAILENAQKRGDLATLQTTHKSTIVGALNELKSGLNSIDLTAVIDDAGTGTDKVWSSDKVQTVINSTVDSILGGAPEALDTLKELSDALQSNPDIITVIQDGLAKRVRVDAAQTFSEAEKTQGRGNIGAASASELDTLEAGVGAYGSADFVATYVASRDAA